MCPTGVGVATAACTLLSHVSADDGRQGQTQVEEGEQK